MSEVLAVVGGLGAVSFLFLYGSFSLKESSLEIVQNISVFLSFMGLVFMNIIMFVVLRISQETPSLNYLTAGPMITGFRVMTWTSVVLAFALFLAIVIQMFFLVRTWYREAVSRRRWS